MKLTIESVNDEQSGAQFLFHGDADEKGLHSFAGTADDINTAFDMAKEWIVVTGNEQQQHTDKTILS